MKARLLAASLLVAASAVALPGAAWAQSPLADALAADDRAAALALIEDGADVNAAQADGSTPLMWAAYHGDADLTRALLRAGAEPGRVNDYGASALGEAARFGNAEVVRLLLEAGADPNVSNHEGMTPLMMVARTGAVDAAEALIAAGADPNAVEQWSGQTALMWAAARHHPDMVTALIDAGADPDAQAFIRDWDRRVTSEPRPKDMDRGGLTPLTYAAREGCAECVTRLIAGGADPDKHDGDRASPLVLALMNMHYEAAAALIEGGADLDKWDLYGQNPVYMAVDVNTTPAGGRPDIPSQDALRAMDILQILLDRGANPNLQLKVRPPYRNVIQDRGGDSVLGTGATPLLRAAKAGDNEAIRILLSDARTLVDLPTSDGVTPLMTAAGMGHGNNPTRGRYKTEGEGVESIRLLAAAGADVNAQADNGQTAVHAAVSKGWGEIIRTLAELGADLQIADNGGNTALAMARGEIERGPFSRPADPQPEIAALLEELIAGESAAMGPEAAACEPS